MVAFTGFNYKKKNKKKSLSLNMLKKMRANARRERKLTLIKFRNATKNNKKVVLLTAKQVKKWYNMPEELMLRIPVAAVINKKPRYIEYQVDVFLESLGDKIEVWNKQTGLN